MTMDYRTECEVEPNRHVVTYGTLAQCQAKARKLSTEHGLAYVVAAEERLGGRFESVGQMVYAHGYHVENEGTVI